MESNCNFINEFFQKMNHSRTINCTFNVFKAHFSMKARKPKRLKNHYDTLEISHASTQEDIKSAYYELSKKYHPDKNTAADAKQKFQDVSDAYETLSNFSKRKQYDRDLQARGDHSRTQKTYEEVNDDDPMSESFRPQNYPGAKYDFDAWTRAHYGDTLKRSIQDKKDKVDREEYKRMRTRIIAEEARRDRNTLALFIFFFSSIITIQALWATDYDKDMVDKRKASKS